MSHQPIAENQPVFWVEDDQPRPDLANRHTATLLRLGAAFRTAEPLVLLTSDGRADASDVITAFLGSLPDDVDKVRLTEPCIDAISSMRAIVHGIGFQPKDMSLADLENVLNMFLSFQQRNERRTVICMEETQDSGWWVLDHTRRLIEKSFGDQLGLTMVLAGRHSLIDLLDKPPLEEVKNFARTRLNVAPFKPEETREYVRRRVEESGEFDVTRIFDYQAIARLHEVSNGVQDEVDTLCMQCLKLVTDHEAEAVTPDLVDKVNDMIHDADEAPLPDNSGKRVIARMRGEIVIEHELELDNDRVLIGRDKLCDIRLPSKFVSRHQALIVNSSRGLKILDLGSRNGSFVEGKAFRDHELQDKDVITFGDCTIEYVAE